MSLALLRRRALARAPADLERERRLFERCAELLADADVEVLPYRDASLPVLRSRKEPALAVESFQAYVGALEDCAKEGISPRDSVQLVWRFVHRLGLRPQSDVFQHVTSEDVVEIYTPDNLQIFRNLRFFELCSFTLEELVHAQWNKVSKRSGKITLRILGLALLMKTGNLKATTDVHDLGDHLVEELMGDRRRFYIGLRYLSPLWLGDRVAAIMAVHRSRLA